MKAIKRTSQRAIILSRRLYEGKKQSTPPGTRWQASRRRWPTSSWKTKAFRCSKVAQRRAPRGPRATQVARTRCRGTTWPASRRRGNSTPSSATSASSGASVPLARMRQWALSARLRMHTAGLRHQKFRLRLFRSTSRVCRQPHNATQEAMKGEGHNHIHYHCKGRGIHLQHLFSQSQAPLTLILTFSNWQYSGLAVISNFSPSLRNVI